MIISEKKEDILVYLAKYKFLTVSQLETLGVSSKMYLQKTLKILRETKLTNRLVYAFTAKLGKFEDIHFLTARGAAALAQGGILDMEAIQVPSNSQPLFFNDYIHRIKTVDCQISFDLWTAKTGRTGVFFETYFHKVGSHRKKAQTGILQAKTRLYFDNGKYFEPDGVFMYENEQGDKTLATIEICNNRDTKKIENQVKNHLLAFQEGLAKKKYNHDKGNYILFVFSDPDIMKFTIDRLLKNTNIMKAEPFLLFKSLDRLNPFGVNWVTLTGELVTLK
jgi:hypothetical protein